MGVFAQNEIVSHVCVQTVVVLTSQKQLLISGSQTSYTLHLGTRCQQDNNNQYVGVVVTTVDSVKRSDLHI